MQINRITLENFRQYYGHNPIDLKTGENRNIVIIGGRNGYGKTNFLLSLVWCLYGENISQVDDHFKKEITKEGNYAKFVKSTLNWTAARNGVEEFAVELLISGIELPETATNDDEGTYDCQVKRTYNVATGVETFTIDIIGVEQNFIKTGDDKINFVNDYLIPLEAAKFVFFDAEKIASWAELSTKEEGSVLNDAVGKVLGLDVYEDMIDDLQTYCDGLRKESATAQVKQQISSTERGIELNNEKLESLDNQYYEAEDKIAEYRRTIAQYESFLAAHAGQSGANDNLEALYERKRKLEVKSKELEQYFNDLAESLPFAILAPKLGEVIEHLERQDKNDAGEEQQAELRMKSEYLIEQLFNLPPAPPDGDISLYKKVFYADKAKGLIDTIFGNVSQQEQLPFEHDLNRADKELIQDTFGYIKLQSQETFELTIDAFNDNKDELTELEARIKKIEADLQDEEIIEYANKKSALERKVDTLIESKGTFQNQKDTIRHENERLHQQLQLLLKKISVSEQKQKKLEKATRYIKSLEHFVIEQKTQKCHTLETSIYAELSKLMHKLNQGGTRFIAGVRAEVLPENSGLKITLYNDNNEPLAKEALSQGEKQIYISCLIKAIISLSISEYPVFIDTPLGRLDDEHIRQILLYYYPDLASQVVLMATNNEIPPSRYKMVADHVARTYLLENIDKHTSFKAGYFN